MGENLTNKGDKITMRFIIGTFGFLWIIFLLYWLLENARMVFGTPLDYLVIGLFGLIVYPITGLLIEYSSKKGA